MDSTNGQFWSKYSTVFDWNDELGEQALDILMNYKSRRKLKFTGKLEDNFRAFYFAEKFPVIRFSMYLGLMTYLLFGILDYLVYPEMYQVLWSIRFVVGSIFVIWTLVMFETANSDSNFHLVQSITLFAVGLSIIAMMAQVPFDRSNKYYAGLMVTIFYIYSTSGLLARYAIITGISIEVTYILVAMFRLSVDGVFLTNNIFFLTSANLVGFITNVLYERNVRKDFLMSYILFGQTILFKELNSKLEYLSRTDQLTQLANRRYLKEFVDRNWQYYRANRKPVSMLMIDIDYFKNYNDKLGHSEGDKCLVQFANLLKKFVENSGYLAIRFGGEEFILLLPDVPDAQAVEFANKLRYAVMDMKIPHPDSSVSRYLTISIGVATMIPDGNNDISDLILTADKALYQAKAEGRNRVVAYSS